MHKHIPSRTHDILSQFATVRYPSLSHHRKLRVRGKPTLEVERQVQGGEESSGLCGYEEEGSSWTPSYVENSFQNASTEQVDTKL